MASQDPGKPDSTRSVFLRTRAEEVPARGARRLGKLVFRNGPFRGKTIVLNPPEKDDRESEGKLRISIGRNEKNDVAIDAGMIVSSFHARITLSLADEVWWLQDLGSKNGTYLNGERIEKSVIREGDVISFALTGPEAQFTLGEPELPSLFETTRSTFLRTRSVEAAVKELLPATPSQKESLSLSGVHRALDNHLEKITDRSRWVAFSSAASLVLVLGLALALWLSSGTDSGTSNSGAPGDLALEIFPDLEPIYGSLFLSYRDRPVGRVRVVNRGLESVEGLKLRFELRRAQPTDPPLLVEPYTRPLPHLDPGDEVPVQLLPKLSNHILSSVTREVTARISLHLGEHEVTSREKAIFVHDRNVFNWQEPQQIAAFVDPQDLALKEFVEATWPHCTTGPSAGFPPAPFRRAVGLLTGLADLGLSYLPDAQSPISRKVDEGAIDRVSFPWETLVSRTGDCDDLTVLTASVLERVGIETLIAVTPDHVFLLFDSGLPGAHGLEDTPFDPETVVPWNDRIWIPIEATALGERGARFETAWAKGWARKAEILAEVARLIPVREAWKRFSPMNPSPDPRTTRRLDEETWVREGLEDRILRAQASLDDLFERNLQKKIDHIVRQEEPGRERAAALGHLYATSGLFAPAQRHYLEALFGADLPRALRNELGIRKKAQELSPDDYEAVDLLFNTGICFTLGASLPADFQAAVGCYRAALDLLQDAEGAPEQGEAHLRLALIHRLQGNLQKEKEWVEAAYRIEPGLREKYQELITGDGARAGENERLLAYLRSGLADRS